MGNKRSGRGGLSRPALIALLLLFVFAVGYFLGTRNASSQQSLPAAQSETAELNDAGTSGISSAEASASSANDSSETSASASSGSAESTAPPASEAEGNTASSASKAEGGTASSASGSESGTEASSDDGYDPESETISEDAQVSDRDGVALYLHTYGHLPDNYITKKEAEEIGWRASEGNLWKVAPGYSIGGDRFGNREGLLPKKSGRTYYECDIDYSGGTRNAKRIVFSDDGLIFYTDDHYSSFTQLYDAEGAVNE